MELTPYVESIQRDLSAAAEVAGDQARTAAERLTAALDAAVRLALLDALSTASEEITRDLAPGSVEVRMRGREPSFVVTPPPAPEPPSPPAPPGFQLTTPGGSLTISGGGGGGGDIDQGTSRITLRLPETLKSQVEEASAAEGISVNAWLVRTIATALSGGPQRGPEQTYGYRGSRGPKSGKRLSGWAR
ncbi:hypothetical protein [Flindersiella endophytica]